MHFFFLNELLALGQPNLTAVEVESLEGVRGAVELLCRGRAGRAITRSRSQREKAILHLSARVWVTEKQQSEMKEREEKQNGMEERLMLIRILRNRYSSLVYVEDSWNF